MTFRAFALAGSRLKLSFVRVGSMAVHALGKLHRRLEIVLGVAIAATHLRVHSLEGILCFGVVKLRRQIWDNFPAARRVTRFASTFERALVRIGVAVDAGVKLHPFIFYGFLRSSREVALLAVHFCVQSRERILRLGMVELLCLFPID